MSINYNLIISSCDGLIRQWVFYYEQDRDKAEDNIQELRIKLWNALRDKYDSARGGIYGFCFGIIKQEAKKFVLDASKYRQEYFENTMSPIIDGCDIDVEPEYDDSSYDDFINNFSGCLTYNQDLLFKEIDDKHCDENYIYRHSGKLKLNKLQFVPHNKKYSNVMSTLKKKLFIYAKSKNMMVNLSTADAGIS
jgi:hypothetical protein